MFNRKGLQRNYTVVSSHLHCHSHNTLPIPQILAYVSLFGQIAMIASLAVICFYASKSLVEYAPRVDSVNLWGFPVFFGTVSTLG